MKKLLSLCIGMLSIGLHAADTVFVKTPQVPILIERHDNVLAYLRLDAKETKTLDNVTIQCHYLLRQRRAFVTNQSY